jgi:TolB-like protein
MLAAGSTLGPYKIVASLGAGGMGEVYRAHDTRLGRDVAIKVLPPHLAATPEVRARFEREARTISQLNHPHICTLHDFGHQDDTDFLVMELLEGETLAHRVEKGPLPVAEVLRFGGQIATALDAAHRAGVVHRDLKPGNVMLTKAGAKLLDFGLARAAGLAAAPGTLTESPTVSRPLTAEGTIVGTFQYMAPEQLEGKEADARTDLWALGCVLYEMATGKRAFEGQSQASLIAAILEHEPRPITELQPLTPPALERAVHQCFAKDPDKRWQNAGDLARELAWIAEARPRVGAPPPVTASSRRVRRLAWAGVSILVVAVVALAALWMTRIRRPSPHVPAPALAHGHTDIAVLPFQNLSAGGPHAYFAGGLHDELLTQLAKVAALKVISRTSVMGYANSTKPLKQIAAELGVGSVVEGTVQVENQRLRVTVQLIDAATDEHLWAEHYDRTLNDAFAIQSDVAQRIVEAVGAALGTEERQAITATPTANPEAYRLFLQGEEYSSREGSAKANLESAQRFYERALALDPGFAQAHASLSVIHGRMYWFGVDVSPVHVAKQREEAEIAVRLAPRSPVAHNALALAYYWGRRDYRRALEQFRLALRESPSNADAWAGIAFVQRRLGNQAATDTALETSVRLNPRYVNGLSELPFWYYFTHRYEKAVLACGPWRAVAPDWRGPHVQLAYVSLVWRGDPGPLKTALGGLPPMMGMDTWGPVIAQSAYLFLLKREPDSLLTLLTTVPSRVYDVPSGFQPLLYSAWAHRMKGDQRSARSAFEQTIAVLDTVRVGDSPAAWNVVADRGLALAGLGRRNEALRAAGRLVEFADYRDDALARPYVATARAMIFAQLGDADAAVKELEWLLRGPSELTVPILRLDPRWDPIREHPRFKALLLKYANPER